MAYSPEDSIGGWFDDIEGHWSQEWIEKIVEEGIVSDVDLYNPNNQVDRAEMAVFITRAMMFKIDQKKGLAYTNAAQGPDDVELLNCEWYYNWGISTTQLSDPKYVPMTGKGELPADFPRDYDDYLLVFNEPNNPEPYGRDINPIDGAGIYANLKAELPNTRFVVGGISAWCDVAGFPPSYDWAVPFLEELDRLNVAHPDTWHIHGYNEGWIGPDELIEWWRQHRQLTGAEYWITEYGSPNGSFADFVRVTEFIKTCGWIKRYAAFTNRLSGTELWCPPGWELTVPLIHWDGGLTETGEYYIG